MPNVESSNHEHYELQCASAVAGEISAAELVEFREHLQSCSACRVQYVELERALQNVRIDGSHKGDRGYKKRFLSRARGLGFEFSPEVEKEPRRWWMPGGRLALPGLTRATAAVATGLLLGLAVVGYVLHQNNTINSNLASRATSLAAESSVLHRQLASAVQTAKPSLAIQSPVPASPNAVSEEEAARLRSNYEDTLARSRSLERQLSQASARIAELEQEVASGAQRGTQLAQQVLQTETVLNEAMTELRSLRERRTTDNALTAAQQSRVDELSAQLKEESETIDRDRKMLAADRDIRELMGARNLHIIDVSDVDSRGKTRRPYGRAFYTEGKSLIFYAFDLEPRHPSRKALSFQAWGFREPTSQSARSLGIFYADDKADNRWVLKFDDPDVLAEIDAVFVTVEPSGGSSKPTGHKLLYAYLKGQANHP